MKIYLPTFDYEKQVTELESTDCKVWKSGRDVDIINNGTIYNGKNIFKNAAGAWDYWNWNYAGMRENRLDFDEIPFKQIKVFA